MDLNTLTKIVDTITQQSWLHGLKAGLAVIACTFLYLETQVKLVTPELRERIIRRTPLVLVVAVVVLGLGHSMADSTKAFAFLKTTAGPVFLVVAASVALFAYAVHGVRHGILLERNRQVVGAILATVAITFFFLFFHLSYKGYYHRWELFHYYMGSKYTKELSYKRIYICAAVADAETGNETAVKRRKMRDLSATNLLIPSKQVLEDPQQCKSHFTPERWAAFKQDLVFFRQVSGRGYWNDMQKDHGYNPPPIWTISGHYLSELQPASDAYFKLMASIDVVFTALLFIAIGWAFGWRVAVIGALFWGTQEPAPFYWTGGAFLRQDWFLLAVLSACLARKRHYFLAGAALTYAAGLRVFPVLLWAGPLAIIAWDVVRNRKLQAKYMQLLGGGVLAAALLFPWSLHVTGGFHSWTEWAHHIKVHQTTPLTNHTGLKTVIATSPDGRMKYTRNNALLDPFERWKSHRNERFDKYKYLHWGIVLAFGALLVYAMRRVKSLWVGMGVSLILVVSVVEATCYYYSIWILAALLTRAKRQMEWPLLAVFLGLLVFVLYNTFHARGVSDLVALLVAVGAVGFLYYYYHESLLAFSRTNGTMAIAVVGLGGASQVLSTQFYFIDDKFTAISALYVAWSLAFLLAFVRRPERPHAAVEPLPVRTA
ncbi:MAG: hypothetical protein MUF54_02860 [Polyangiaceae bacterium]|nr:hypothetical protein [Polyangiaceae bacterium]